MRNITILADRLKDLSFQESVSLLKETLFIDEMILVYKFDLSGVTEGMKEGIEGVIIGKGDLSDLEQARQDFNPLPWEFRCHEYDGIRDFFVAKANGQVRHINWVYRHDQRNRLLTMDENEAELKFGLTLPEFRGQGLMPKVVRFELGYLKTQGIERVFICVNSKNRSSIRGIEKAGFSRVCEMRLKKFLGVQVSPRLDTSRIL